MLVGILATGFAPPQPIEETGHANIQTQAFGHGGQRRDRRYGRLGTLESRAVTGAASIVAPSSAVIAIERMSGACTAIGWVKYGIVASLQNIG